MSEIYEQTNMQHHLSQLRSEAPTDRLAGATGLAMLALRGQTHGAARARRATSAAAMETSADMGLLASVKPALSDRHTEVRRTLAFALGELKDNSTSEMLATLAMDDPESTVRAEAVEAIAKFGGPQAVKMIQQSIEKDSSIEVRLRGVRALTEVARRQPDTCKIISQGFDQLTLSQDSDLVRDQLDSLRDVLR